MSDGTQRELKADCLVVGGGLSGLMAARALAAGGVRPLVLEARDRVGGRTWSRPVGKSTFDLGAQWIGPSQDRLAKLAGELGVATFPTFHAGEKILDRAGRVSHYSGNIPSLPWWALLSLHRALSKLDGLTAQVPLDRPHEATQAAEWDQMTVATFRRQIARTPAVRDIFDVAVRTVFGAEPSELSMLHFLFYLNSGGGLMSLVDIEKGAQQRRFVGGVQQLSAKMAAALGDAVELGAPTRRVEQTDGGLVARADGLIARARFAIVAVAPPIAGRIEYAPSLPVARTQLMQRMPMGHTVKVLATYERAFWREAGMSGEVVATMGARPSASVTYVVDNSSHDGAQPCLLCFLVGEPGRRWSALGADERKRVVLRQLVQYFGDAAATPTDYVEQDWATEPWTGGCPSASAPPGVLTGVGRSLREPCGRIHWAGTETATDWNGYMEGALEAGERAADEVLARL